MQEESKNILGTEYSRYPGEPFWKPKRDGHAFLCDCGSMSFTLFYPIAGYYQLNARCIECGAEGEVYSG